MSQVTSKQQGRIIADNVGVVVAQVGNTAILEAIVEDIDELGLSLLVAGQALDAFVFQARMSPDAAYQTILTTTATPGGVLLASSGELATQAVGSGYAVFDVRGFYSVKFLASSGNVAGSTVDAHAIGKGHRV